MAEVVKKYIELHSGVTIQQLKEVFPKKLQGTYEVVNTIDDIKGKDLKRYKTIEYQDQQIYITNQWGIGNFPPFMDYVNNTIDGINIKKIE